jgi:uncharacterized protein YqgV (UPF0045/DUF77 family)
MRLVAEFTTEPFEVEGQPPAHVTEALRGAEAAGLDCDFGPFGTQVRGDQERLLPTLTGVMEAAFARGASQVTSQVRRDG